MGLKSNYSNLKSYSISRFYEKYIFSREGLTRLRDELSGLRSNIKLLLYSILDKNLDLIGFFFQITILYNFFQLLWQFDFYYMFGYFLFLLIYIGLFLIYYDLDLMASMLWIVYGGVFIVFFIYSIVWLDGLERLNYGYKNRLIFFILPTLLYFYIFAIVLNLNSFFLREIFLLDFFALLIEDVIGELELMGWSLSYFLTFLFILISYLLLISCLSSINIIANSKRIKYNYILEKYNYILSFKDFYFFLFIELNFFLSRVGLYF